MFMSSCLIRKSIVFLLFISATTASSANAQTIDVWDFEDSTKMNAWIRQHNVPALGLGLIKSGQLVGVKMYGELQKGKPAPSNSIFNVASITKTITTMLTLKLVSAGKWNLDEPLYRYWTDPDVQDDPRSKKITTRHILNQESGFPNWRRESESGKLVFQFEPGSKYQYSGEGFEYLRRALEKKFNKTLDRLAEELIFNPLDMNDSRYVWNKDVDEKRIAVPHDAQGNALPVDKNQRANAADLVTTTIYDLSKFLIAMMNGEGISKDIATAMVSRDVKTKDNCYAGLGCFIYDELGGGEYAISHGGDDRGVHTIFFILPKSRQGIIIFTNSDNGPKLYADILKAYFKDKGEAIVDIEMKTKS